MRITDRPFAVHVMTGQTLGPDYGFMGGAGHIGVAVEAGQESVAALAEGLGQDLKGDRGRTHLSLGGLLLMAFVAQGLGGPVAFIGVDVGSPMAVQADPFLAFQGELHHFLLLGRCLSAQAEAPDDYQKKDRERLESHSDFDSSSFGGAAASSVWKPFLDHGRSRLDLSTPPSGIPIHRDVRFSCVPGSFGR